MEEYGHRKMIVWRNIDRLEATIYRIILPKISKNLFNLRDQIERATSSIGANFIEGYYSGSIREYVKFLGYSKRSLAELQDWIRRSWHKRLVSDKEYNETDDLIIKTMYLLNRLIQSLKRKSSRLLNPTPS